MEEEGRCLILIISVIGQHSHKVLSFLFQSIPPMRRRPVICRILEDEERPVDMSVAEPVGQENNLDNWVMRENQVSIIWAQYRIQIVVPFPGFQTAFSF